MSATIISKYGDELYQALRDNATVAPLTERDAGPDLDTAYRIPLHILQLPLDDDEPVTGNAVCLPHHSVPPLADLSLLLESRQNERHQG